MIDKMTYALSNPVKDNLVDRAHHWPGVTSLDFLLHARPFIASRPKHFFRDEGPMPEVASLSFARPEGFGHLSATEYAAMMLERIRAAEEAGPNALRISHGAIGTNAAAVMVSSALSGELRR